MSFFCTLLVACMIFASGLGARAQNKVGETGAGFVRGTVVAMGPDEITIAPRAGGEPLPSPVVVKMAKTWTVALITPTAEKLFAKGTLINVTEVDQPGGVSHALVVDEVDPDIDKKIGAHMGRATADLVPGAMGTLGPVVMVRKTRAGILIEQRLPNGETHRSIAPVGTAWIRNTMSTQSMVKLGSHVSIVARATPDGLMGSRVLVGARGSIPPL
jgi:hypothetical protein